MTDPAIPDLIRQKIVERNGHFMHKLVPDWKAAYTKLAEECGESYWLSLRFIAWTKLSEKETVLHSLISVLVTKPADMTESDKDVWRELEARAIGVWLSYADCGNFRRFAANRIEAFQRTGEKGLNYVD